MNGENCVMYIPMFTQKFNFEVQKCDQILCADKTHFLMPGHNIECIFTV